MKSSELLSAYLKNYVADPASISLSARATSISPELSLSQTYNSISLTGTVTESGTYSSNISLSALNQYGYSVSSLLTNFKVDIAPASSEPTYICTVKSASPNYGPLIGNYYDDGSEYNGFPVYTNGISGFIYVRVLSRWNLSVVVDWEKR